MRNRYNSQQILRQQQTNKQVSPTYSNTNLYRPKYQLKSPPIIEIYDLEKIECENTNLLVNNMSSSSLSSSITSNEFYDNNNNNLNMRNSNGSFSNSSQCYSSSSPRSSIESGSLYASDSNEEPFTFQEFISSIINCNEKEWHTLIIQDLSRLIELKFRDFKKSITQLSKSGQNKLNRDNVSFSSKVHQQQNNQNSSNINNYLTENLNGSINNSTISINTDIFTRISERIFELASEEPYGILGARIKIRLMLEGGKFYDICNTFPYDSSTMATSEIVVTLKEDITSFKKFLQAFKLYSNIGKYFALHIDSNNFEISKTRLY